MRVLTLQIGKETYAVDISLVREVIEMFSITRVPRSSTDMWGVINLRGSVVPVKDLRKILGLNRLEATVQTRIIILETPSGTRQGRATTSMGIVVDAVQEVVELDERDIGAPPRTGTQQTCLHGMGKHGDITVLILDVALLFDKKDQDANTPEKPSSKQTGTPKKAGTHVSTQPSSSVKPGTKESINVSQNHSDIVEHPENNQGKKTSPTGTDVPTELAFLLDIIETPEEATTPTEEATSMEEEPAEETIPITGERVIQTTLSSEETEIETETKTHAIDIEIPEEDTESLASETENQTEDAEAHVEAIETHDEAPETTLDEAIETHDEVPETTLDGAPETTLDEAPETALDEAPETTLDEAPETTLDEAPETTLDEAPETTLDEAPETTLDEAPETALDEAPETTLDEAPETTLDEMSETTLDEAPETTLDEAPETTLDEAPETTLDEAPETTLDEAPETTLDEAPETTLDEAPETTLDEAPEAPETTLDEAPETTLDEAPETTLDEAPETTLDEAPETTLDEAPETTLDEAPETTLDEAPETTLDEAPETHTEKVEPLREMTDSSKEEVDIPVEAEMPVEDTEAFTETRDLPEENTAPEPQETMVAEEMDPSQGGEETFLETNRYEEKTVNKVKEKRPKKPVTEKPASTFSKPSEERIQKSFKVDEEIFQEGLAMSLDQEKRSDGGRVTKKSTQKGKGKKRGKAPPAQTPDSSTLMDEFQSMVEEMFPSAKMEKAACATKDTRKKGQLKVSKPKKKGMDDEKGGKKGG